MQTCLEPGENEKLLKILVESSSGKFFATFVIFSLPVSKGLAGLGSLQLEWSIYTYLQSSIHGDGDVTKDKSILAAAQFPLSWIFLASEELQSGLCRQLTRVKGLKI